MTVGGGVFCIIDIDRKLGLRKMKLEKFKEKDNKRKFIIIFTICCVFLLAGVFLYTSFAVLTEDKQFNVINGTYQDPGDLYYAIYIDDQISNTIPSKDGGYTLDTEKSSCTNGATITWDNDSWSAVVNLSNYSAGNMSRTKCTMYFKEDYPIATDYIISLADSSGELVYDETTDNNLRYIGANPNNYVSFNDELWRIIGVFNNIDDGTGTKETRLKIIRAESIGHYSWDNKASGTGSSTSSYGSSDWSDSALQIVLNNGVYWNRTSGECPYGQNGATTSCDFSTNGLIEEAKAMISNAKWNLGGTANYTSSSNGLTSHFYGYERGTTVYTGRPTEWIGQIGLMYPSDYGYATSGGSTTDRASCLAKELYNWDSVSDCYNNDWLSDSSNQQWTLTPRSSYSDGVFYVSYTGYVGTSNAGHASLTVSPALYLSSNVRISGGTGEASDPFTLTL